VVQQALQLLLKVLLVMQQQQHRPQRPHQQQQQQQAVLKSGHHHQLVQQGPHSRHQRHQPCACGPHHQTHRQWAQQQQQVRRLGPRAQQHVQPAGLPSLRTSLQMPCVQHWAMLQMPYLQALEQHALQHSQLLLLLGRQAPAASSSSMRQPCSAWPHTLWTCLSQSRQQQQQQQR
jgi:hypothetical protein